MFAAATQLSRSHSHADALPFEDAHAATPSSRGAVIWITGVAGIARAGLVDLVRARLEPWWNVDPVAPEEVAAWIDDNAGNGRIAIVVAHAASAAANGRARADAADLTFIEILAVSDWDALVERADSSIFAHLASFFAQVGHGPAPRRRSTGPDAVIRLDWHGPKQVAARIADALQRAGLIDPQRPPSSRALESASFRHP